MGDRNNIFYDHRFIDKIIGHLKKNPNDLLTLDKINIENIKDLELLNNIFINDVNIFSIKNDIALIVINNLFNARHLGITKYGPVDFSNFKRLESLGYEWFAKTKGFESLVNLKQLSLSKYKSTDLSVMKNFPKLEGLNLFYGKIKDLSGIENLEKLNDLMLYNLRDLEDLSTFKGNPNVEILDITSCKKLDVNILPNYFPNVHTLTIESQGEIATIEPLLLGFSKLKVIKAIENTKILDAKTNANYQNLLKDKRYYIKGIGTSKDW
jgi:hypothetical protein